MKIISILFVVFALAISAPVEGKNVSVRGHVTKQGKYISPNHRTSPDHSKFNNWSSKGNVNPYTGKAGTKNPQ